MGLVTSSEQLNLLLQLPAEDMRWRLGGKLLASERSWGFQIHSALPKMPEQIAAHPAHVVVSSCTIGEEPRGLLRSPTASGFEATNSIIGASQLGRGRPGSYFLPSQL